MRLRSGGALPALARPRALNSGPRPELDQPYSLLSNNAAAENAWVQRWTGESLKSIVCLCFGTVKRTPGKGWSGRALHACVQAISTISFHLEDGHNSRAQPKTARTPSERR